MTQSNESIKPEKVHLLSILTTPFSKNMRSNAGIGLIEVVVASAIGLIIVYSISGALGRFYSTERDLNLRTELTERLKSIRLRADCSTTLAGITDFSTVPAAGQPIEIKSFPSGATLIAANGSTLDDKFSFIANVKPDRSIQIRAALLATPSANPRSLLTAADSAFKKNPVLKNPWNWAYSDGFIQKAAPSLSSICGATASAGTPGKYQLVCGPFADSCAIMNTETGRACKFAFGGSSLSAGCGSATCAPWHYGFKDVPLDCQ